MIKMNDLQNDLQVEDLINRVEVKEEGEERVCRACQDTFRIEEKEKIWFIQKNLDLPLRCKPCRKIRREQKRDEGCSSYKSNY